MRISLPTWRVCVAAAMASLALIATTVGAAPSQAATSGPRAVDVAARGLSLTWSKMGDDAYRLRFSKSASMANPRTVDIIGNYAEWTRTDANPTVAASRLSPSTTYYFQVKAIRKALNSSHRTDLTNYSAPVAVTTAESNDYQELAPVQTKVTSGGAGALYVSWRTRGPGIAYELQYRASSDAGWSSRVFGAPGGALSGLDSSTTYQLRVRVIDKKTQRALSDFSDVFSATTGTAPSTGITVASYNVRKPTGKPSWASRRALVAAEIKAQSPDVIALQEATPVRVTVKGKKVRQYQDVLKLLGSKYAFVNNDGTSGTRLAYNKTRFSRSQEGSKRLRKHGGSPRYAVWAVLKDNRTGKRFFAINTHLEPGSNQSSALNSARVKQAKEVLALQRTKGKGLPAIVAGDMNSSRSAKPFNGPYRVFTGAGLIDPLDNATGSWMSGQDAVAEHLVDAEYNSYNGKESIARRTVYPIGTNVDTILVSPGVRVSLWRTAVNLTTSGRFVGTIPSDHNLVAAIIHLR